MCSGKWRRDAVKRREEKYPPCRIHPSGCRNCKIVVMNLNNDPAQARSHIKKRRNGLNSRGVVAQWLRNCVKPCAWCFGRVGMVRPTSACSLSCETCQRHSAASASGSAGKAGQGPCSHCISPMGMVNVVVGVNGRAKARAQEVSGAAAAVLRTLESLHDTQAVFLLMRDSPLDIVDEGSVSRRRCRCVCCGEGRRRVLPKRYRQRSPVRLCELMGGTGILISSPIPPRKCLTLG